MKSLTLIEHSFLYSIKKDEPEQLENYNIGLPEKVFQEIETFVLKNEQEEQNSVVQFLIPAYHKSYGKILKAKNYVGVLQTKKGITIEILPKICGIISENEKANKGKIKDTKKIFLRMLRSLKSSNFKISNFANLDLSKMQLLDVFINMFLDELDVIIKQGLRKDYLSQSENLHTLKGKLNFNKNIRHNLIHKERFFVEFDEFKVDRPENRLIKSTLLILQKKAYSNTTQQRVRMFSFIFEEISESKNVDIDLVKCKSNRLTLHYDKILVWCKIFLKNKTFSSYKGDDLAFALLFPMERIFEDFVADWLKNNNNNLHIQTQKVIGHLLTAKKYKMKPDIVINGGTVIADTKWKILDKRIKLSQADLYQIFAYATKPIYDKTTTVKTKRIILIYPLSENFPDDKSRKYTFRDSKSTKEDLLELQIYPFDLNIKNNDKKNEKILSLLEGN